MIKSETRVIDGTQYTYTYSDAGSYIERDGVQYEDAYDPAGSGRTYQETDVLVEDEDATAEDYEAALAVLGVIDE